MSNSHTKTCSDSDDESPDAKPKGAGGDANAMYAAGGGGGVGGGNAQLNFGAHVQSPEAVEFKKGYVMRKCCYDSNNKKSECAKTVASDFRTHAGRTEPPQRRWLSSVVCLRLCVCLFVCVRRLSIWLSSRDSVPSILVFVIVIRSYISLMRYVLFFVLHSCA